MIPDQYNPQSLNRYSYCLNNPLIYTDPTGHINEYQFPTIYSHAYSWRTYDITGFFKGMNEGAGTINYIQNTSADLYWYNSLLNWQMKSIQYSEEYGVAFGELGINYLRDPEKKAYAKAYIDPEGRFTVHAEGNRLRTWDERDIDNLHQNTPAQLYEDIIAAGYKGGDILLLACYSGLERFDGSSVAKDLANILKSNGFDVTVTAPTDKVAYEHPTNRHYLLGNITPVVLNGGKFEDFTGD